LDAAKNSRASGAAAAEQAAASSARLVVQEEKNDSKPAAVVHHPKAPVAPAEAQHIRSASTKRRGDAAALSLGDGAAGRQGQMEAGGTVRPSNKGTGKKQRLELSGGVTIGGDAGSRAGGGVKGVGADAPRVPTAFPSPAKPESSSTRGGGEIISSPLRSTRSTRPTGLSLRSARQGGSGGSGPRQLSFLDPKAESGRENRAQAQAPSEGRRTRSSLKTAQPAETAEGLAAPPSKSNAAGGIGSGSFGRASSGAKDGKLKAPESTEDSDSDFDPDDLEDTEDGRFELPAGSKKPKKSVWPLSDVYLDVVRGNLLADTKHVGVDELGSGALMPAVEKTADPESFSTCMRKHLAGEWAHIGLSAKYPGKIRRLKEFGEPGDSDLERKLMRTISHYEICLEGHQKGVVLTYMNGHRVLWGVEGHFRFERAIAVKRKVRCNNCNGAIVATRSNLLAQHAARCNPACASSEACPKCLVPWNQLGHGIGDDGLTGAISLARSNHENNCARSMEDFNNNWSMVVAYSRLFPEMMGRVAMGEIGIASRGHSLAKCKAANARLDKPYPEKVWKEFVEESTCLKLYNFVAKAVGKKKDCNVVTDQQKAIMHEFGYTVELFHYDKTIWAKRIAQKKAGEGPKNPCRLLSEATCQRTACGCRLKRTADGKKGDWTVRGRDTSICVKTYDGYDVCFRPCCKK
ncbi:hypothetical protein ACHAXT_012995, partial [Thalassiosira profunda]